MQDTDVSKSPEVIKAETEAAVAEAKVKEAEAEIKIKMMRLDYYKGVAATAANVLQTFKAEAVSLVAGGTTLAAGYYQIRKIAASERVEIKKLEIEKRKLTRQDIKEEVCFQQEVAPSGVLPKYVGPETFVLGASLITMIIGMRAWSKKRKTQKEAGNVVDLAVAEKQ